MQPRRLLNDGAGHLRICGEAGVLDLDAELTASQLARAMRVSRQLVNYWRSVGALRPCGTRHRRPVYRFGDGVTAEARMRSNPRSSRCPTPGSGLAPAA